MKKYTKIELSKFISFKKLISLLNKSSYTYYIETYYHKKNRIENDVTISLKDNMIHVYHYINNDKYYVELFKDMNYNETLESTIIAQKIAKDFDITIHYGNNYPCFVDNEIIL